MAGFREAFPIESPDLAGDPLTGCAFGIQSEKLAGGGVREIDPTVGIENDHPFTEGFENFRERSFFADQAGDELVHFARVHAVEAGDEFVEKAGFHGKKIAGCRFSVFRKGMNVLLVFCTFPDRDKARQIGTVLVEKQLAACVNLLPGVESIYRWEGKIESSEEVLAIFKTSESAYPQFKEELIALHPYDVPEIIAVKPEDVVEPYAKWVYEETRQ